MPGSRLYAAKQGSGTTAAQRGRRRTATWIAAALVVVELVAMPAAAGAAEGDGAVAITRLTRSEFSRGDGATIGAISGDGQFVVVTGLQRDFIGLPDGTVLREQTMLIDRATSDVDLVSVSPAGLPADGSSTSGSTSGVSDDGRYVVFASSADNLVAWDSAKNETAFAPSATMVFLRDRKLGSTTLVSRSGDGWAVGAAQPSISADGAHVTFMTASNRLTASDTNGSLDTYLYTVSTGTNTLISKRVNGTAAGIARHGEISRNGRTIVYSSTATDLVSPATTVASHVYAHDVPTGTTTVVSTLADGTEQNGFVTLTRPRISHDGRRVGLLERGPTVDGAPAPNVLDSTGDTGNDIVVKDLDTGAVVTATVAPGAVDTPQDAVLGDFMLDADGSRVVFAARGGGGWATSVSQHFVHDLTAQTTFPVHAPFPDTDTIEPFISGDGLSVVFADDNLNLVTPDRAGPKTPMASTLSAAIPPAVSTERFLFARNAEPDGSVLDLAVSDDGRWVAFTSAAPDLIPEGLPRTNTRVHLYVLDRATGEVTIETVDDLGAPVATGALPNGSGIDITPDGRFVAFVHTADLDPDPSTTLDSSMVFVRDRDLGTTTQISLNQAGAHIAGSNPSITDDGTRVAFETSRKAAPEDDNAFIDIYVHDLIDRQTILVSKSSAGAVADESSRKPDLAGDGSSVVFESRATNLVPVSTSAVRDIYRHTFADSATSRVSQAPDGTPSNGDNQRPRTNVDGSVVAWVERGPSGEHNLDPADTGSFDVIARDMTTGALDIVSVAPAGDVDATFVNAAFTMTSDGRFISFSARGSGSWGALSKESVYLRDREAATTRLVTRSVSGGEPNDDAAIPAVIDGGRGVLFLSGARDLTALERSTNDDIFVALIADTAAPVWGVDASLTVSDVGQTVATLTWTPASDDVAVTRYRVLRDGTEHTVVDGMTTSVVVTGLTPDTTYTFSIDALDAAENSTLGPSRQATTLSGEGPATLIASPRAGGVIDLTWDPATGHDGYRILRINGTEVLTVADVGAGTTTYSDTGLAAATTFTYRVDTLTAGTAGAHTGEASATTPNVFVASITWNGPRARSQRLLRGADVTITAIGDPNRTATAIVAITSWFDVGGSRLGAPAARDIEVPLTQTTPGTYVGLLELVDGIAEVTDVDVAVEDDAAHRAGLSADEPAVGVTGTLAITMDVLGGDFGEGQIIATRPATYGALVDVGGGVGPFEVVGLAAGTGYDLAVRRTGARVRLVGPATADVTAGLVEPVSLQVQLLTSLAVDLTSSAVQPDGTVQVSDSATGDALAQGRLSGGLAGPFAGLDAGRVVNVTFAPSGRSFHNPMLLTPSPITLADSPQTLTESVPSALLGTVSGTAREFGGTPHPGGIVEYAYRFQGRYRVERVEAGSDGTYSLQAPTSNGHVTLIIGSIRSSSINIVVTGGETTTQDLIVPEHVPLTVAMDIYTQLPGGELTGPIPMSWRELVHYRVTMDGRGVARGIYPVQTLVLPSASTIEVCADGAEIGLPAACVDATIEADGTAHARLDLVWPGGVSGTLLRPSGAPLDEPWEAVIRQRTGAGHRVVGRVAGGGSDLLLPVPSTGTYHIDVISTSGLRTSFSTSVSNELASVGAKTMSSPWPFAGLGNEVSITSVTPGRDGWVDVRVEITNASTAVSGASLVLEYPAGTTPTSAVATLDGAPVTSTVTGVHVAVPLGLLEGSRSHVVHLRLPVVALPEDPQLGVLAFIESSAGTILLGRDTRTRELISLFAPPRVPSPSFVVSGLAMPEALVSVVDDRGFVLVTVSSDASGRWQSPITLIDRGPWYRHELRAELVDADLTATSQPVQVEIDETMPSLEKIVMYQAEAEPRRVEIQIGTDPTSFPYTFGQSQPLILELEFTNPDQVRGPIVVVGRTAARATRRVDGKFVAQLQPSFSELGPIWITFDNAFGAPLFDRPAPTFDEVVSWDPRLAGLTPDDFSVTETTTSRSASRNRITSQQAVTALAAEAGTSSGYDVLIEGNKVTMTGDYLGTSMRLEMTVDEVDHTPTAAQAARQQATGLPIYEANFGAPTVTSTQLSASADFLIGIHEDAGPGALSTSGARQALWHDATTKAAKIAFKVAFLGEDVSDVIGTFDTVDRFNELRKQASECNGTGSPYLDSLADTLVDLVAGIEAIKLGNAFIATAGGPLATVAAWQINNEADRRVKEFIDDFESEIKRLEEEGDCDPDPDPDTPDPLKKFGECVLAAESIKELDDCGPSPVPDIDPTWIHDPSGYVFEGVPSNRLEGVKTTLFTGPTASGPWTVWDAAWFGQQNPMPTDRDGRYGWDVPEGWWLVQYQADGYLVGQSDALEVLPPHFDVNEPLINLTAPSITAVRTTSDNGAVDIVFDRYMLDQDLAAPAVVLLDDGDSAVPVTISYLDSEADLDGRPLSTRVRLTPLLPLTVGDTYTLVVDSLVRSYAETPLGTEARLDILVTENAPPVASADSYDATEDVTFTPSGSVLDNDLDPDGHPITTQLVSEPSRGSLALSPDGTFTYVPERDFAGVDTFEYRASDGASASAPVTVTLRVAGTSDPATLVADSYSVTTDSFSVATPGVLANDTDPDGDELVALVFDGPDNGDLDLAADGSFSYTPVAGFSGTDQFRYRAWDGYQYSRVVQVNLEVTRSSTSTGGGTNPTGPQDPEPTATPTPEPTPGQTPGPTPPGVEGPPAPEDFVEPNLAGVLRIAGPTRYATAVEISRAFFEGPIDEVIIATGQNHPDALTGATLAAARGVPLLLVKQDEVPAVVIAEMARLRPRKVTLLGGTNAVSAEVEAQLRALSRDGVVVRLHGQNRWETAAKVAAAHPSEGRTAYIASGVGFADATVAGPLATDGPILLVARDHLPEATVATLVAMKFDRIVVLGGPAAVSDTVLVQLDQLTDAAVVRLHGPDRYATAAQIADQFPAPVDLVFIATGSNFPDALTAGVVGNLAGAPILLVPVWGLPETVVAALDRLAPRAIVVLGGEAAVPASVADLLADHIRPPAPASTAEALVRLQ